MAVRKRRDLTDDELIRFQRFIVEESAAATFTQQSFDTQLSIDRGLIWMIHWIELQMTANQLDDSGAGTSEDLRVQITRESKSALIELEDTDLICMHQIMATRYATIGTDTGPVVIYDKGPAMVTWPLPLVFSSQNIYVGVQGSAAAAKAVRGRIAYTLRRVSDKFFYRVAQALIS